MVVHPTHNTSDHIRPFVLEYFRLLGAGIEHCGDDLYRVELSQEQHAELEGRPLFAWNVQNGPSLTTNYFTFTPRADLPPEVECITIGSQRLHQIIASVRRQAEVSYIWTPVPALGKPHHTPHHLTYRPFNLMLFRVDAYPGPVSGPPSLVRIAVDLVDGIALRKLAELVLKMDLRGGLPPRDSRTPIEKIRFDLDDAFDLAFTELIHGLHHDHDRRSWAIKQNDAVQKEIDRLKYYFSGNAPETDGPSPVEQKRIDELHRLKPQVIVRLQNLTVAHLPVAHVDGTPDYLPFAKYLDF